MNKDQANELKVGIVVLLCLGLGLGVALRLSNWQQWLEPKNTLTFKVPYQAGMGGIKAGWPVTIGGVAVGSVREISSVRGPIDERDTAEEPALEAEESQTIAEQETQSPAQGSEDITKVTTYSYFKFTVPSKYELYEDCELTPASQLIGGAGELMITNFGSKGKLLQDGDEVFRKSLGGSSIAAVMDTVQAAMANVHKITEDFKDVSAKARTTINQAKPDLERTFANVRAASEEMKLGMREIRWNPWRLLHNPSNRELRTQNLLTSARAFSSGASDVVAAVDKLEGMLEARKGSPAGKDEELIQAVEELTATMDKFSVAAETFFKRLGKGK